MMRSARLLGALGALSLNGREGMRSRQRLPEWRGPLLRQVWCACVAAIVQLGARGVGACECLGKRCVGDAVLSERCLSGGLSAACRVTAVLR